MYEYLKDPHNINASRDLVLSRMCTSTCTGQAGGLAGLGAGIFAGKCGRAPGLANDTEIPLWGTGETRGYLGGTSGASCAREVPDYHTLRVLYRVPVVKQYAYSTVCVSLI